MGVVRRDVWGLLEGVLEGLLEGVLEGLLEGALWLPDVLGWSDEVLPRVTWGLREVDLTPVDVHVYYHARVPCTCITVHMYYHARQKILDLFFMRCVMSHK